MRGIEETRKRWKTLFLDNDTNFDLRSALRGKEGGQLCNDGLRSICWKVLLLFEDLERRQWLQKITESRDAYSALRAHFLKYIEHPDDLESTVDPLAEDEESPWQTLRNDEKLRAEILQDVERCLQENPFFKEPATKRKLTDILFIYSKLNPDVGYRQGMHELLAPLLWVIDRDSIQQPSRNLSDPSRNIDEDLMLNLLDDEFVEHDSFTLFLRVMQTARMFYEHDETKSANGQMDVIPIVHKCEYLHQEALMVIDHELAEHLQAVDVLPQIFLTRWMRLLFGREFPFDDVLKMWDVLFAHGLRSDLVDFTCIAMLLRIRWQLLQADYSTALSMLLRYPPPQPHAPDTFVHDALYLEQNPTAERGNALITKYSGRQPLSAKRQSPSGLRPARQFYLWEDFKTRGVSKYPIQSSVKNSSKSIETLFQDVSQGIQRRTEAWGVAKAVRGAVTEAKRNMQTMHIEPSSRIVPPMPNSSTTATETGLERNISRLEERNKALSIQLGEALNDLRLELATSKDFDLHSNYIVKQALSRAESVQECLADPSLPTAHEPPISEVDRKSTRSAPQLQKPNTEPRTEDMAPKDQFDRQHVHAEVAGLNSESETTRSVSMAISRQTNTSGQVDGEREVPRSLVRPSLADAEFSWMLEGNRNISSFVSSVSVPPEQSRHRDQGRNKGSPLFGNNRDEKLEPESNYDELALRSLRGAPSPS